MLVGVFNNKESIFFRGLLRALWNFARVRWQLQRPGASTTVVATSALISCNVHIYFAPDNLHRALLLCRAEWQLRIILLLFLAKVTSLLLHSSAFPRGPAVWKCLETLCPRDTAWHRVTHDRAGPGQAALMVSVSSSVHGGNLRPWSLNRGQVSAVQPDHWPRCTTAGGNF